MLIIFIQVRDPNTGQSRQREFRFDPATLDATKMAAVRTKLLAWASELANDTAIDVL